MVWVGINLQDGKQEVKTIETVSYHWLTWEVQHFKLDKSFCGSRGSCTKLQKPQVMSALLVEDYESEIVRKKNIYIYIFGVRQKFAPALANSSITTDCKKLLFLRDWWQNYLCLFKWRAQAWLYLILWLQAAFTRNSGSFCYSHCLFLHLSHSPPYGYQITENIVALHSRLQRWRTSSEDRSTFKS